MMVIILMKTVRWLDSARVKRAVVRAIASVAYLLSSTKRRSLRRNLGNALNGSLSKSLRRRIVKGSFLSFWQEIFSLIPAGEERKMIETAEIRGIVHLEKALEAGRGVILWESSFFGRRLLAKQILHERGYALYQTHGETHLGGFLRERASATWVSKRFIAHFLEGEEKRFVEEVILLPYADSLAFGRTLLERLRRNGILVVSGEGRIGQKTVGAEFLGRMSSFPTGLISLSRMAGAPILPIFCIQGEVADAQLIIEAPIKIDPEAEREEAAENGIRQYLHLLESYIRAAPEMYYAWDIVDRFHGRQ